MDHRGFQQAERRPLARFSFSPCPRNDFNGAEFLYFASFQAVVDRAEWAWWCDGESPVVSREVYFHGNLDVGERLSVVLCGLEQGASHMAHWCEVVRDGDGRKIADVFTLRSPARTLRVGAGPSAGGVRQAMVTVEVARAGPEPALPAAEGRRAAIRSQRR